MRAVRAPTKLGRKSPPFFLILILLFGLLASSGCGGASPGSPSTKTNPSTKVLNSITVTPASMTLKAGATQQLTVTGTYSDHSQADVTSSAVWTTSDTGVATVNASGLLSAVAAGSATITATVGSSSANASLTVTPLRTLSSITISPATLTLSLGGTQQLTATGTYSDDTQKDLTSTVIWNSSSPSTASVAGTGLLSAVGTGLATVTATANSISAHLGVVVNGTGANVATWHYDNGRTGLNPTETTLTPANVNQNHFGKLFSYLVDGYIYGQPLYVSHLTIAGAPHDVVFVASENDSVYAFDADQYGNGTPLWKVSLLQPGETPQPGGDIKPFQGITSTPAIDAGSGTMYVVSSQQGTSNAFFRLHALDLTTGAEKFGGPVVITASVPGTNADSVNGVVSLTTSCLQRASLLLANNTVFIGFGGCHSGWLLAYDAQTLAQTGVFNMSPNLNGYGQYGGAGGVWMGGGGPAADANGNIYVTTGNGPYDVTQGSYGESVMRFSSQLQLLDHFTPSDWAFLQCRDSDLASGGLLLIPGTSYAVAGGKQGKLFLADTLNLGGMQANDAGVQWLWFEQDLSPAYSTTCIDNTGIVLNGEVTGYQIYGTAAFFNGSVYLGVMPSNVPTPGPVRQFTYANGQLTPGAVTADSIQPGSYGTTPFVSANGSANGIVWVLDHGAPIQNPAALTPTAAILRAYDAINLTTALYNSAANNADAAGLGIKFSSLIVANGRVFIGTAHDPLTATNPQGELDVYGLKP